MARTVGFSDYQKGPIEDWLKSKGFKFQLDARLRNAIDLGIGEKGLDLIAKKPALGVMPNEAVNVRKFRYLEIDWGVNKYPGAASWENGVRNQAIMVIVFLGDQRQPSGSMFIPDSPYFIGLFLCSGNDRTNHPFVGAHFKKGGRYVCADKAPEGKLITSRFDLMAAYREYFDKEKDDDPAVTGIALEIDTTKAKDGGKSSAFIKEIRFFR
ncbi:MAG: hypothetical protein OEO83_03680 [Alphaproteobacteria bacterium]|nr:hypothetical protein [Alphaproteobacteria bacterium]